jgi:hypothetical protein
MSKYIASTSSSNTIISKEDGNTANNTSFRSSKSFEWTQEDQKLLEAGFIKCKDGSLIPWKPYEKPDTLVSQMETLKISKKITFNIPITIEEEIAENIAEWQRRHPK